MIAAKFGGPLHMVALFASYTHVEPAPPQARQEVVHSVMLHVVVREGIVVQTPIISCGFTLQKVPDEHSIIALALQLAPAGAMNGNTHFEAAPQV